MDEGDDEIELSGSSIALFNDSDVAGIFYEKTPPKPLKSDMLPQDIDVPSVNISGTTLKAVSIFDTLLGITDTSPEGKQKQKSLLDELREQICRLEQDNVTLVEELDNISLHGAEKTANLEANISSLQKELESTKSELREITYNVKTKSTHLFLYSLFMHFL